MPHGEASRFRRAPRRSDERIRDSHRVGPTSDSPSMAGAFARSTIIGPPTKGVARTTNGWVFRKTYDAAGKLVELDVFR